MERSPSSPILHTVSELNQMVSTLLADCFPTTLWITGEVSNFSCPRSGHWYFSLKDAKSQVRCAFFQGQLRSNGLQLSDGMQLTVQARLRLYEHRGEFQLVIEHIELAGEGALRQAFESLKSRLAAEGLFDAQVKKALPTCPKCVGVITSATGAAIRDILSVLKRRFPALAVIIYPSLVQGENAAAQIAQQLNVANVRAECEVLILARGGGSLEDLWPFNEVIVARAIYQSQIPVVSAVGHEIDFTISDFVSDLRAATPSAAAELVSPNQMTWFQNFKQLETRLIRALSLRLESSKQYLSQLKARLRHPGQRLQDYYQRLDELEQRMQYAWKHQLQLKNQHLDSLARALEAVSPLSTLARGYALVKNPANGKIIYDSQQIKIGEPVIVQLSKGELICTVLEITI